MQWFLKVTGEKEARERRAKRREREESPGRARGTEAHTLAQLPLEMQPDLLQRVSESTKSNHITPLCVNTRSTNICFRELVKTGDLTGGMDHKQTCLKTKCQNNILWGLLKATQLLKKRGRTIQHCTISNLQIKTTEEHFKHLCLLFPLISENVTRLQCANTHMDLCPPTLPRCPVTQRFLHYKAFVFPLLSPLLTHILKKSCKQIKASRRLFRLIWTALSDSARRDEAQVPACLCLCWDAQLAPGCYALSPAAASALGTYLQMLKETENISSC